MKRPGIVVLSTLFPSQVQPGAGTFVRERMFRVGRHLPLTVVSPQPWFPGQRLIGGLRPGYRIAGERYETDDGIEIFRPRFFALPGLGRRFDAFFMAVAAVGLCRKLRKQGRCDIIDAHFAFPDGCAAGRLARWLDVPFCVTLRGTEPRHLQQSGLRSQIQSMLRQAARIFSVSDSLRQIAAAAVEVPEARFSVVGNGVDTQRFTPVDRSTARQELDLPNDARVLITVGGLVERKGFHRVIEELPALRTEYPDLVYLIVGGPSREGDWTERLKRLAEDKAVSDCVRFLGPLRPDQLSLPLSASDVFVLPSSNEGWANVILEAMACGTPVVASDVGGNAEVVCSDELGIIYPFAEQGALREALRNALAREWNRDRLLAYARENSWDERVARLVGYFEAIFSAPAACAR